MCIENVFGQFAGEVVDDFEILLAGMEDQELVTFEICMWRPNRDEVRKMARIIKLAGESL